MTTLIADAPTFGIIVPYSLATLESRYAAYSAVAFPAVETPDPATELTALGAKSAALVSRLVGAEGLDQEIAEALSAESEGRVLLLRFGHDGGAWAYQGGAEVAALDEDATAVAAQQGLTLPASLAPELADDADRSLCYVVAGDSIAVARALGHEAPPEDGPLHIEQLDGGVAVYNDLGGAGLVQDTLSDETGLTVYLITAHPSGEFSCWIVEDAEDVGIYEYPERVSEEVPPLDSIAGETEPVRILHALKIPPHLLGLSDD